MLEVDVISEPSATLGRPDGSRFWKVNLEALTQHDVDLVKPAVLFGDRVKLISFRNDLKSLVRADSFENLRMPLRYMQNYAQVLRDRGIRRTSPAT